MMVNHNAVLARFREIGVGKCDICAGCDATDKRPLLPWHIGREFGVMGSRLVIIGKNHRDDRPTDVLDDGFQDARHTAEELQAEIPWPYWSYVRQFLAEAYGDWRTGWDRIARTNLVKCTTVTRSTGSADTTTRSMRERCIRELGAVREEMALMDPDLLVLMTGRDYDNYLGELAWQEGMRFQWVDDPDRRVPCGAKNLAAARFEIVGGSKKAAGIRVGHPERMKKDGYVRVLGEWFEGWGRGVE